MRAIHLVCWGALLVLAASGVAPVAAAAEYKACSGGNCVDVICVDDHAEAHAKSPDWGASSTADAVTDQAAAHDEGHWYADAYASGSHGAAHATAGGANAGCGHWQGQGGGAGGQDASWGDPGIGGFCMGDGGAITQVIGTGATC